MAGSDSIELFRGEDRVLVFQMNPVEDVTGWTLQIDINLPTPISKAAAVSNGAAGTMAATLVDTETDSQASGTYQYELWRTDAGLERVLAQGPFHLKDVIRTVT